MQDLLRGTGLGSDAGVVIEAQMIDRLLSDRADERRSLFEEAAGIGLYRDRKESTERQLERTAEDLRRLDDLLSEVQREVRSLARQRGRSERHARLLAERFAIVMTLAGRELEAFDARQAELDDVRSLMRAFVAWHRERHAEDIALIERYFDAGAFEAIAAQSSPSPVPSGCLAT